MTCACGCGGETLPKRKYVKGHRPIKPTRNGYIRVWRPGHPLANNDGNVLLHRLVLYEAGVEIPAGHHVHHRNGDKTDNGLENLEILPVRNHVLHHARERGYVRNQYGRWPLREQAA